MIKIDKREIKYQIRRTISSLLCRCKFVSIRKRYLFNSFLNITEHSMNRTYDNSLIRRALYHWVICPLEWLESNQRMFVSKTNALPLGYIPWYINLLNKNRDGVIWTRDLLNPNQIRYQATLHPVYYLY